ncbi:uncharacterized protein LOC117315940 [Pecten maximus]|uniref:uncharacterized protein LOC117315940 n=1 Tax=Pecten maximus TaxID=6579 RepID=UPI0014580405|nr:uncharacterized protein LOC117315940 [Pecten maximus]
MVEVPFLLPAGYRHCQLLFAYEGVSESQAIHTDWKGKDQDTDQLQTGTGSSVDWGDQGHQEEEGTANNNGYNWTPALAGDSEQKGKMSTVFEIRQTPGSDFRMFTLQCETVCWML